MAIRRIEIQRGLAVPAKRKRLNPHGISDSKIQSVSMNRVF